MYISPRLLHVFSSFSKTFSNTWGSYITLLCILWVSSSNFYTPHYSTSLTKLILLIFLICLFPGDVICLKVISDYNKFCKLVQIAWVTLTIHLYKIGKFHSQKAKIWQSPNLCLSFRQNLWKIKCSNLVNFYSSNVNT